MRSPRYQRRKRSSYRQDTAQRAPALAKSAQCLAKQTTVNGSVRPEPRQNHRPNPHNRKPPTKPNPAISRLSASPTPGNATRYPNVAHGVRETCNKPALRYSQRQTASLCRCADSRPQAAVQSVILKACLWHEPPPGLSIHNRRHATHSDDDTTTIKHTRTPPDRQTAASRPHGHASIALTNPETTPVTP